LQAQDQLIFCSCPLLHVYKYSTDDVLVESWQKEYEFLDGRKLVPLLCCVSVDCFEEDYFVVEDKHGLMEEYGLNPMEMNNGVTLVKPRENAWLKSF